MEGQGTFRKAGDSALEGTFKSNYYMLSSDVFISPFHSRIDQDESLEKRYEIKKVERLKQKEELFKYKKLSSNSLINFSLGVYKCDRIPIFFSSQMLGYTLNDMLKELNISSFFVFELRKAKKLLLKDNLSKFMEGVKANLAKMMVEGGIFIINIDESEGEYKSPTNPDLREFYSNTKLPSQLLEYSVLSVPAVYKRVLEGTEFAGKKMSIDFSVLTSLT